MYWPLAPYSGDTGKCLEKKSDAECKAHLPKGPLFLGLSSSSPGCLNNPELTFLSFWPHEIAESLIFVPLLVVRVGLMTRI